MLSRSLANAGMKSVTTDLLNARSNALLLNEIFVSGRSSPISVGIVPSNLLPDRSSTSIVPIDASYSECFCRKYRSPK